MKNKTEEVVEEQLTEIEQKRLENIEAAHATNKLIIAHENYNKNKKFKTYDIDLRFKSNLFYKELNKMGKNPKFNKYKRGQVVSVNFGTNIGSELSGEHFAIVLTKRDNEKSELLTVVPLTSKYNENYIPLGKEVWNLLLSQIASLTDRYVENYNNIVSPLVNNLINILDSNEHLKIESNKSLSKTININTNDIKSLLDVFSHLNVTESFISKFQENKNSFDKYFNKEDINNILNNSIPQEYNISKDLEETLKLAVLFFEDNNFTLLNNIFKNTNELYNIIKSYVDKDKDSYAIVNQITTISKYKIRKVTNDNDPMKHIKISNPILDIINKEIIRQFTK